eukprot:280890_1
MLNCQCSRFRPKKIISLTNKQWKIIHHKRLNIPIINYDLKCSYCKKIMASYCQSGHHCISRHDNIVQFIGTMAKDANLNYKIEKSNLVSKTKERPADIFIENWEKEKRLILDVGITAPISDAKMKNFDMKKYKNGSCADNYFQVKNENFERLQDLGELENSICIPFIFETFGLLHKKSKVIFDMLCFYISQHTGRSLCDIKAYYSARIASKLYLSDAIATLARYYIDIEKYL